MTRGIRNKNPFNIKIDIHNNWKGKILEDKNSDGTFEQFKDITYGLRAGILLLHNYIRNGYNTVGSIISRFCPDDTLGSYINYVCQYLQKKSDFPPRIVSKSSIDEFGCPVYEEVSTWSPECSISFGTQPFFCMCVAMLELESNYVTTSDALRQVADSFNLL